jgi:hypothetical protein
MDLNRKARRHQLKAQAQPKKPLRQRVSEWMIKTRKKIKNAIDQFINFLFNTTEQGGETRRWLFIIVSAGLWAFFAYINQPPHFGEDRFADFISYPFETLFHPEVFRHVLVSGLTFWLAIQLAASYLDDVFELNDPNIAESYILKASLANRYQSIEVKEGKINRKKDSTIVRIGGPGLVRVHFDSAALFEKLDGEPTVITAEDGLIALDRFERLRRTFLLRDHIDETSIQSHTRDGIAVGADGVRIKFHIHREEVADEKATNNQDSEKKKKKRKIPYPIVRSAVKTLVYDEKITKWINPISLRYDEGNASPEMPHPESLEIKSLPIQAKIKDFISERTLGEFLASISEPEIRSRIEDTQELESEAMQLTGEVPIEPENDEEEEIVTVSGKFYPRDEITEIIYSGNDQQDKLKTGLELDWIDIGTWVLPENAQKIVMQHEIAWELALENITNRSPQMEMSIKGKSRVKALQEFLRELIFSFETNRYSSEKSETIRKLLFLYSQMLLQAQEIFRKNADPKEAKAPIPLSKVNHYLAKILGTVRKAGSS